MGLSVLRTLSVLDVMIHGHLRIESYDNIRTFFNLIDHHKEAVLDPGNSRQIKPKSVIENRRSKGCPSAVDDCDFFTETGEKINCDIEHESRAMYGKWIPMNASVLEIGARYGQTTCALSGLLREKGKLTSVEADPGVWNALQGNLERKNCSFERFHLVKGIVGREAKSIEYVPFLKQGYGTRTGNLSQSKNITTPPHPLETLDGPFDTLCIDCEGCFKDFIRENPEVLWTAKLIIVEVHNQKEERQMESLLSSGRWKKVDHLAKEFVLCASSSLCPIQDSDC